jgi:hypothetical protein
MSFRQADKTLTKCPGAVGRTARSAGRTPVRPNRGTRLFRAVLVNRPPLTELAASA